MANAVIQNHIKHYHNTHKSEQEHSHHEKKSHHSSDENEHQHNLISLEEGYICPSFQLPKLTKNLVLITIGKLKLKNNISYFNLKYNYYAIQPIPPPDHFRNLPLLN